MIICMTLSVLVAGGTGRFAAVASLLLERGHRVRVTSRDPASAVATRLAGLGAEVVTGDFDDPAGLEAAARGVDAVFAAGTAHRAGPAGEARHGINIATAAAAAGVGHLVYVSGAGADAATGIPVLESKAQVERRIRAGDAPWTILAPAYLMENLLNPWSRAALGDGIFPSYVPLDRALQQVATIDIAAVAAHVIEHPDGHLGQRIELASTTVTARQLHAALVAITGRPLELCHLDPPPPLVPLFRWLDEVGFAIDVDHLRATYPDIAWHNFNTWAHTIDWSFLP
jgi:uncharacterized protein YbjT (DUF2867 family)